MGPLFGLRCGFGAVQTGPSGRSTAADCVRETVCGRLSAEDSLHCAARFHVSMRRLNAHSKVALLALLCLLLGPNLAPTHRAQQSSSRLAPNHTGRPSNWTKRGLLFEFRPNFWPLSGHFLATSSPGRQLTQAHSAVPLSAGHCPLDLHWTQQLDTVRYSQIQSLEQTSR